MAPLRRVGPRGTGQTRTETLAESGLCWPQGSLGAGLWVGRASLRGDLSLRGIEGTRAWPHVTLVLWHAGLLQGLSCAVQKEGREPSTMRWDVQGLAQFLRSAGGSCHLGHLCPESQYLLTPAPHTILCSMERPQQMQGLRVTGQDETSSHLPRLPHCFFCPHYPGSALHPKMPCQQVPCTGVGTWCGS